MATKAKAHRPKRLIDLKPGEADVLSFVAAHAGPAEATPILDKVLSTSTRRAQAIGAVILGKTTSAKPIHKVMAKRFTDASESNRKHARVLENSAPKVFKSGA